MKKGIPPFNVDIQEKVYSLCITRKKTSLKDDFITRISTILGFRLRKRTQLEDIT